MSGDGADNIRGHEPVDAEEAGLEEVSKDISDTENVVRAVCTPYHVDLKKGKLKKAAFRQKIPTTGVSVYRTVILSSHSCKERGKALSDDNKTFVGLACVAAGSVRSADAKIEDSRELFYGHADIFILTDADGYAFEEGEPLPPHISELRDARIDSILQQTKFFPDTQPDAVDWAGPDLATV